MSSILNIVNADNVLKLIKEGKRLDGRNLDEFRNLEIKTGVIPSAAGSAWVKLGNTEIIAGIKFAVGSPYPDSPDEGSMSLNLELTGISSPDFFTGPPQIDAIEYGRVADRALRSSEFIDFKKLSIVSGEKVFVIFIDCIAINADGNLIDATEFAALAALLNTKIPILDENNNIGKELSSDSLPIDLNKIPLSITFEKIDNKILIDPTEEEEFTSNTRFSLGLIKDTIVSCQKSKGGSFSEDEINIMIDLAIKKYDSIIKIIKSLI
ncbi:MAG: exosome complex protein Rrp42 [Candidatus ainarchaeum sp.]|nr:exosome complex protein Rrp42 [Candidatus ainarchaeum sp.]MDD3975663.1 exosome complex protein Rrp42 [Candidatus ainarchaeum sp.]